MADVIKNEEGQLMLLTVFMIIIGVVSFTYILNSMIFSSNLQSAGLEESKQEIRDFRLITESEVIRAANYANTTVSDPANQTQVLEYFYNYMNSFNDTIKKIYSFKGASVDVIVNNISLNETLTNMTVNKYYIEWKNHTFPSGSLVIPMDENQTQLLKVYGLVYKIVDNTGTAPLNSTRIPVWTILQNPVNDSVVNFSSLMNTDDNASGGGNLSLREYSGGPFLIDVDDIDAAKKELILDEAKNKSITVHLLISDFYYDKAIKMEVPPKVAVYPVSNPGPMTTYYTHGEVPYTLLDNDGVRNNLTQFDILTIPHYDMKNDVPGDVITRIVFWVANGGVLHAQCEATDTMDAAVEQSSAGSVKPWYGFIGINRSSNAINLKNMTYIKLVDNTTRFDVAGFTASDTFNTSPPISRSGLADPGAPFSPLAQSYNRSGILGNHSEGSTTPAFSLRSNGSQVNPGANILGYAAYANGTPVYVDDNPSPVQNVPQFIYIEAPYENGLVSYLAGHNQSTRIGGERLLFETFFAASMRKSLVTAIAAKNINVTIKYFDGKVRYTDTFIINS